MLLFTSLDYQKYLKDSDWSKLKTLSDDILGFLKSAQTTKFGQDSVGNIAGKCLPAFLLFPKCFQRLLCQGCYKLASYTVKAKT